MDLSTQSKKNIDYFLSKLHPLKKTYKQTKILDSHLTTFYHDILTADQTFTKMKNQGQISIDSQEITTISQIPKPRLYTSTSKYFPTHIKNYIEHHSSFHLHFSCKLHTRIIKLNFILMEHYSRQLDKCYQYAKRIFMWLDIAMKYSSKTCTTPLHIYLYMTPQKKELPSSQIHVLGSSTANSAATWIHCPSPNEIFIFRKEEWFKVFIHETFHNLGLDFSSMNLHHLNKKLGGIFHIPIDFNPAEAYCDFWARIMNSAFTSYELLDNVSDIEQFKVNCSLFFELEREFSLFQCVKVLKFMGLNYTDIISNDDVKKQLSMNLYKEDSHIFSYYVLTAILMNNYIDFFAWCDHENVSLFHFRKSENSLNQFFRYIHSQYKTKSLLRSLATSLSYLKKKPNKNILRNTRMSLIELI
jgi:hypothetical protein